MTTNISCH